MKYKQASIYPVTDEMLAKHTSDHWLSLSIFYIDGGKIVPGCSPNVHVTVI